MTHLTKVLSTLVCNHARSWWMSLMLAPRSARSLVSRDTPPGLSLTVATKRTSRPSAASPRSITRPSTGVSMLPPQIGTTTFLPLRSGRSKGPPGSNAATPAAPPPSLMVFSASTSRRRASAISNSLTCTHSSTCSWLTRKAREPTTGTANPSAKVDLTTSGSTGAPAARAALNEAQNSGSTPITLTLGFKAFTAKETPAIRPAPPTGTTMTSTSDTCSRISTAMVPAPAIISASS
mmetsp:Transcript_56675/g.133003  ORF Transcript_56675/g.133003 Transcript_56675/m.133003 type:complete len:236 (-) Transcript_56675:534-1241(-)